MAKSFFYGFAAGLILAGILWFSYGRNDLTGIRSALARSNADFEGVQRTVNELRNNSDGFAETISDISNGSQRAQSEADTISERLGTVGVEITGIAGKVDELEQFNRKALVLGRDLGDVAAELRRLREESGTAE